MADRRRLAFVGVISIALALDEKGMLVADPEIEMIGIPETDAGGEPMLRIAFDAALSTFEQSAKGAAARSEFGRRRRSRRAVRSAVAGAWGKKPLCRTHVLVV